MRSHERPRGAPPERQRAWWIVGLGVLGLGVGAGAAGLTAYWPLDRFPWIILLGAGIGVALNLLFYGGARLLRRRGAHLYAARKQLPGLSLGLLALGVGGTTLINGACDPHPLVEQEAVITRKFWQARKKSHLEVADWRPGRQGQTLALPPCGLFERVSVGSKVIVVAGPGLLDWWFSELRLP